MYCVLLLNNNNFSPGLIIKSYIYYRKLSALELKKIFISLYIFLLNKYIFCIELRSLLVDTFIYIY